MQNLLCYTGRQALVAAAVSWVARGASFAERWDIAEKYAREAFDGSVGRLEERARDDERHLSTALGALFGYATRGEPATPEQELDYLRGAYQKQHPIPSWMSVPVSAENFRRFGVSTTPTLVLSDRKGIVQLYHPGDLPYEALAAHVDRLLD